MAPCRSSASTVRVKFDHTVPVQSLSRPAVPATHCTPPTRCSSRWLSPPSSRYEAAKWPRLEAQIRPPSYSRHHAIGWSAPILVTPEPTS
jgi:hypothetical protein